MNNIFDFRISELLNIKENRTDEISSSIKNYISNCENVGEMSKNITDWLNILITEYNSRLSSDKNLTKQQIVEYDKLLYDIIKECVNYVSLKEQPVLLTNMCILSDDEYNKDFHEQYFVSSLNVANDMVLKMLRLSVDTTKINIDDEVLLSLGFLNFRAHHYDESKEYLCKGISLLNDHIITNNANEEQKIRYFTAKIHLASCYEYIASDKELTIMANPSTEKKNYETRVQNLSLAIEQLLGNNIDQLKDAIIEQKTEIRKIISKIYKTGISIFDIGEITSLIKLISSSNNPMLNLFFMEKGSNVDELKKEYLHVTAHCLSEYSAIYREQHGEDVEFLQYPVCSILQLISRFLLDWLVSRQNIQYVTCQATVRAENDATPEAIDLLLKQIDAYETIKSSNQEVLDNEAELQFFIFYFAEQELRLTYDNEKLFHVFNEYREKFFTYAEKQVSDVENFDSLFHYYIVYFRYLLKQSVNKMMIKIDGDDMPDSELNLVYDKLIQSEKNISKHVLKPVRNEFLRLKKLYFLYRQIKNINISNAVLNAQEVDEIRLYLQLDGELKGENIDYFQIMKNIYHEIVTTKNILLLAPVKNAPSCSFSLENIDRLITIKQSNVNDALFNCKNFIVEQVGELDKSRIDNKAVISVRDSVKDKFKWAIYYKENELFLYYNDFTTNYEYNMFPVILNDAESEYCNKLMTNLFKGIKAEARCSVPSKQCESVICYSHVFTPSDSLIRGKLFELLEFLEFDFLQYDNKNKKYLCRILDDDKIILYRKRHSTEFRICCFSLFELNDERTQICEICSFSPEEKKNIQNGVNVVSKSYEIGDVENNLCKKVNFSKARAELESQKKNLNETSYVYKEILKIENLILQCENTAICTCSEAINDTSCTLLDELKNREIYDVYGEEFYGK